MTEKVKRFATVRQMPEIYPSFSEASIRWLIFNKNSNGFSACMRKLGKKIIIDLDDFEKWISEQ